MPETERDPSGVSGQDDEAARVKAALIDYRLFGLRCPELAAEKGVSHRAELDFIAVDDIAPALAAARGGTEDPPCEDCARMGPMKCAKHRDVLPGERSGGTEDRRLGQDVNRELTHKETEASLRQIIGELHQALDKRDDALRRIEAGSMEAANNCGEPWQAIFKLAASTARAALGVPDEGGEVVPAAAAAPVGDKDLRQTVTKPDEPDHNPSIENPAALAAVAAHVEGAGR